MISWYMQAGTHRPPQRASHDKAQHSAAQRTVVMISWYATRPKQPCRPADLPFLYVTHLHMWTSCGLNQQKPNVSMRALPMCPSCSPSNCSQRVTIPGNAASRGSGRTVKPGARQPSHTVDCPGNRLRAVLRADAPARHLWVSRGHQPRVSPAACMGRGGAANSAFGAAGCSASSNAPPSPAPPSPNPPPSLKLPAPVQCSHYSGSSTARRAMQPQRPALQASTSKHTLCAHPTRCAP